MDTLKRRHNTQQTPDSPPPKYSDISDPLSDVEDEKAVKTSEKEVKVIKSLTKDKKADHFIIQHKHTIAVTILTLFAMWTRFRVIDKSRKVVWDEAHFGKFGSFYLKREHYFDVHPPLGKLLVAFSGILANYNGSFGFESGHEYPADLDIATMRIFNAAWGALLVPLAYGTARHLNFSYKSSLLAATMILLDNALLTISRFVLLDSMLLFFTGATFYCLVGFRAQRESPFSKEWWSWLIALGTTLGCVLSVKWVGLFAVALAGIYTIEELWDMLGDLQMPKKTYISHWLARIACLIVLPLSIYVTCFVIHFSILTNSGPGDANMGSLFQATLNGSSFKTNPLDISYGSFVTIKNYGYGGGLLHSHHHQYPDGSKQQQVTCYGFRDQNNDWQIRYPRSIDNTSPQVKYEDEVNFIKDGDVIRLFHMLTGRNLHTHPINAPITSKLWEVSAYGTEDVGDIQDNWRVEIIDDVYNKQATQLRSLTTRFRLRHVYLNCYLASSHAVLPQWGFRQQEVVCDRKAKPNDHRTWWNIEEHNNKNLPPAPPNSYKSNFFADLWHLNVVMWNTNNALLPDPDKNDVISSEPIEWPLATTGLRMCNWDSGAVKYFLLGNATVWWASFASIVIFAVSAFIYIIRKRRQIINMKPAQLTHFLSIGKLFFFGWFLHYMPFYMMGRVTYLHHYFPALYFSVFMVPFLLEHFLAESTTKARSIVYGVAFTLIILNFIHFAPFSFGMTGDIQNYASRRWFKFWNLLDN